jgi:signal transduction histidine kinase
VVLLNLEELLQVNLSEEAFQKVVSSINALKRLSSLNEGLILLTKIENRQFRADSPVSLRTVIEKKLQEFESLIELKNLDVINQFDNDLPVKINEQLAEILIGNLLSNAINHNYRNGKIRISVTDKELKICNTGNQSDLKDENIFNRFTKGKSKSYGLGLAIVKDICRTHNLDIHYRQDEMHCFMIRTTI